MINTIIKIGIAGIFIGGFLFIAVLGGLQDTMLDIKDFMAYVPLEYRVGIYFIFGGLALAFGKSIIK